MCRVYLSIPVVIRNRDIVIDNMLDSLAGLSKFSKTPFIFDRWKPGWVYDQQSVAKADIFIFTHPSNAFKFNISTLPSGVQKEYKQAKALGKKRYLAYKTADNIIRFYDLDEYESFVSGIPGSTGSLATFLDKSIEYAPKEEKYVKTIGTVATHEYLSPEREEEVKEILKSIDLRKIRVTKTYDRRLLL